ncbi:hypothetical protein ONR75_11035 [Rhodopseudomonas sp. P2A-2r]|uniref:hypothetical protein n=1 Tax=Rhodopseudomonas sp. P2A-2r TaxID=2991972 RepID=UPI00223470BA|nr:hypothetical protein [Rhodopseudomonas sp. P2A-2r]UZE51094.1 hypothetical protein ONR75_11035 [Rhodopseudomonas sp. P2A-2r]
MSHRRLTERCLFALRSVVAEPNGIDIYNHTVATNLRVVEKFFPELIRITPPPHCDHVGARPLFAARVTARGFALITPHKVKHKSCGHEAANQLSAAGGRSMTDMWLPISTVCVALIGNGEHLLLKSRQVCAYLRRQTSNPINMSFHYRVEAQSDAYGQTSMIKHGFLDLLTNLLDAPHERQYALANSKGCRCGRVTQRIVRVLSDPIKLHCPSIDRRPRELVYERGKITRHHPEAIKVGGVGQKFSLQSHVIGPAQFLTRFLDLLLLKPQLGLLKINLAKSNIDLSIGQFERKPTNSDRHYPANYCDDRIQSVAGWRPPSIKPDRHRQYQQDARGRSKAGNPITIHVFRPPSSTPTVHARSRNFHGPAVIWDVSQPEAS